VSTYLAIGTGSVFVATVTQFARLLDTWNRNTVLGRFVIAILMLLSESRSGGLKRNGLGTGSFRMIVPEKRVPSI
jgi:hypothetical protein